MSVETDEKKRRQELRMGRVQYVAALLALIHVVAFVAGALLGFFYLVRHQFSPGGISGADTLAMLLWALGALSTLLIALGIATLAGIPLARIIGAMHGAYRYVLLYFKRNEPFPKSSFWWSLRFGTPNKLEWRDKQGVFIVFGGVILLGFCWLIVIAPFQLKMLFLSILIPGLFIALNISGRMRESFSPLPRRIDHGFFDRMMRRLPIAHRTIAVTVILVLSTIFIYLGTWLDASAVLIGFREQNVNVRLPKEDFEEILANATRNGLVVNPCEQLTGETLTLQHVDILWQNVGTRSLLRFPSRPLWDTTTYADEIRFETSNGAIANVVRTEPQVRCGEILTDFLFRDSGRRLRPNAGVRLLNQLPWLENLAPTEKIRIMAYGTHKDALPAEDEAVTQRQATELKTLVARIAKLPSSAVEVDGRGREIPKQDCEKRSGVQRTLCETSNRRIEIHLIEAD